MDLDDRYIAGLFDGEGWFQIDRARPKDTRRGVTYQVHARICMRDEVLLAAIRSKYGGSLRMSAPSTERRAAYWSWDVCGEGVVRVVEGFGAHLILKRRQSALALAFQTYKRTNKNGPMSDERFVTLTAMYEQMRELNRKGTPRTWELFK